MINCVPIQNKSRRVLLQCMRSSSRYFSYWNREEYAKDARKALLELEERICNNGDADADDGLLKHANIVSLSNVNDDACQALHKLRNDEKYRSLLAIGKTAQEIIGQVSREEKDVNVVFVSPGIPNPKEDFLSIVEHYSSTLEWIHIRSAGIDFCYSPEWVDFFSSTKGEKIQVTNAKGQFSSVLAEYAIMSCLYFAKSIPRLVQQQQDAEWEKFNVLELRGRTMGIIGYGDIGKATAKLAHALGMKVVALKRQKNNSSTSPISEDEYCSSMFYGQEGLNELLSQSDYVVSCLPLTEQTYQLLDERALSQMSIDSVFINLGRGAVVDELALFRLLQSRRIHGAALDVFAQEPLPPHHPFWTLPPSQLLMSPHNMDQTATFMHEATEFFVNENLPRFILNQPLLNPVNTSQGY